MALESQQKPICEALLYDFCLDWQMEQIDRLELIKQFKEYGWDYRTFENKAKKMNWFVHSMEAIKWVTLQY